MRKLMIWLLAALMALSGFALAEGADATTAPDATTAADAATAAVTTTAPVATAAPTAAGNVVAANGGDAAHVGTDVYFAIPDGTRQMLVRVPESGDPICVDRGDRFEDLMPYGGGIVYLKTENNSTAIMTCNGAGVSTIYGFGSSAASSLSYYGGRLLVLIDGLLHSIEPGTQLCLRLSGSAMQEYVIEGSTAYFLSAGDRMEYKATLEGGQTVSAQAGCLYSLDLNSGDTMLLLKSGCRDLKVADGTLYFHNLANAYAVRTGDEAQLLGYVYSLDAQQRTPGEGCTQPDSGFWTPQGKLVAWYNGALNTETEAGTLALYSPENGATVVSDGEDLYVWESGKQAVTRVQLNGTATAFYAGDLRQAKDLSLIVPATTPDPAATSGSDMDTENKGSWFNNFMDKQNSSSGSSESSGGSSNKGVAWTQATPIGQTPAPAATPVPVGGSSGGSSSGGSSSGGSYGVNMQFVKITGGSVNIRSGPGTGYGILGSVAQGSVLECTGSGANSSGGSSWYQVRYQGNTGWVAAKYAQSSSGPANIITPKVSSSSGSSGSSGGTLYTTGSVYVRSGPGKKHGTIKTLSPGTKVTYDRRQIDDTDGDGYWYHSPSLGGWVSGKYLSGSKSSGGSTGGGSSGGGNSASGTARTTGSVYMRSNAGRSYSAVGSIPSGVTVSFSSWKPDPEGRSGIYWVKVSYNGKSGWVSTKYLKRLS